MELSHLHAVTLVITLGIICQVFAARFRMPSIIVLLLAGFFCGPVFLDIIRPDELLGDLLFPLVSLSVAIILFEGGLSLKLSEIPGVRGVITRLISVGAVVTWFGASYAAWKILKLDFSIASLLGAILTVSGPTVVLPLLRVVRPRAPLGEILKWEGILIDPIGALLAFLVFEIILVGQYNHATEVIVIGILQTLALGGVIGVIGAWLLMQAFYAKYVADYLESILSLGAAIFVYALSDFFVKESGLVAVTVMGVMLANSKKINVHHILEFKENLRHLLISVLFILLSARIGLNELSRIHIVDSAVFLAVLIFVIRPFAVLCSTFSSELTFRDKLFLSFLAPRGIVAAAVASLFALELIAANQPGAELLLPYTFLVIVGTVLFYSVVTIPVGRALGISQKRTEGVLIMGAHDLAREIAKALYDEQFPVLLIDTNFRNVGIAKMEGLPAVHGNILSDQVFRKLDLTGIGRFFALTPNSEANSLGALRVREIFGKHEVYQIADAMDKNEVDDDGAPKHLKGDVLFGLGNDYYHLDELMYQGAVVKTTPLTETFTFGDLKRMYEKEFTPLCIVHEDGRLSVWTSERNPFANKGDKVISLVLE